MQTERNNTTTGIKRTSSSVTGKKRKCSEYTQLCQEIDQEIQETKWNLLHSSYHYRPHPDRCVGQTNFKNGGTNHIGAIVWVMSIYQKVEKLIFPHFAYYGC